MKVGSFLMGLFAFQSLVISTGATKSSNAGIRDSSLVKPDNGSTIDVDTERRFLNINSTAVTDINSTAVTDASKKIANKLEKKISGWEAVLKNFGKEKFSVSIKDIYDHHPQLLKKRDLNGENAMTSSVKRNWIDLLNVIIYDEKNNYALKKELLLAKNRFGQHMLTIAAEQGKFKFFEPICALMPELLTVPDSSGRNAVTVAVENGHVDRFVKICEELGCPNDIKLYINSTAVTDASKKILNKLNNRISGWEAVLKNFGKEKFSVRFKDIYDHHPQLLKKRDLNGENAMTSSVKSDWIDLLNLIIYDEKNNYALKKELLLAKNTFGQHMLTIAAEQGKFNFFEPICALMPELLTVTDSSGRNAVTVAVENGHIDRFVKICEELGCPKDIKLYINSTAVTDASKKIANKLDQSISSWEAVLKNFGKEKFSVRFKDIYDHHPQLLKERDLNGENAMTSSVKSDWIDLLNVIINDEKNNSAFKKELLLAKNEFGQHMLTIAAKQGKVKFFEPICALMPELLKEWDLNGENAITMAERKRQIGIFKVIAKYDQPFVEQLLKKTNRRGHNGVTTAAFENDVKFIEGIHELNPELLLVRDNGGHTAITAAAFKGNFDIIVKLCELNPELLHMKDDLGFTTVTRAFYEGNTDMIELFKSYNLFSSSENPTNMNQQLYWDCLIASIKGWQFQSIKQLNLIYKINTFFLTIKTFLVLSAAYITCKKLLKYLNALIRNYVLTPAIQKRIDGLDVILAKHSKNSANCKEYVFEIYKLSGGVDSLTKSQQEKIEEFYRKLIEIDGINDFIDRCPITLKKWDELEDPVLCVSKFFEKQNLESCKQYESRPVHPVLNDRNVTIEYFQDDIILRLIESHRDMV